MTGIDNKAKDAIFKVNGWLLFICINMIVVNPLWQIINQFNTYTIISSMGLVNAVEGLETLFYIIWISIAFLMFNSIKAGLGLVNVKSGAVETAKKFLRNYAIFFILLYPLTSLISPDYFDLCSDALLSSSIKSLVIIGLAYWYLSASNKVKEIYTA